MIHDAFQGAVNVETLSRKTHLTKRDEAGVDDGAATAETRTGRLISKLSLRTLRACVRSPVIEIS